MAKKNKPFVLSDGTKKNSHGFRIDLAGLMLERFNSNPVMLYMHDPNQLIGQWENLKVENNKLIADPDFDLEDEDAKKIAGKVERGYLKGASLGIVVLDMKEIDGEYVATKSELIEASVVPVPSDAGAIRLYDENRKELTFEEVKLKYESTNPTKTTMDEKDQKIQELQRQLTEKENENVALKAKVTAAEKAEVAAFLLAAKTEGKITDKEVESLTNLAQKDLEGVKALVNAREGKATTTLSQQVQAPGTSGGSTPGRESWTYLKWMKEDPKGLQKLKVENPTEFARLQQTLK